MYQVVKPNNKMMAAFQNVLYGKLDCWDIVSEHDTLVDAETAANKISGRIRIRLSDDPNPNHSISEKYHINPSREPELAARIAREWERENSE